MGMEGLKPLVPAVLAAFVLTACGGGSSSGGNPSAPDPEAAALRIGFSYPLNGQDAVPVGTDVVLSLSRAIDVEAATSSFALLAQNGDPVPASLHVLGGNEQRGHILRFDPTGKLNEGARYRVVRDGEEWLSFSTAHNGPRTDLIKDADENFRLAGHLPQDGNLPFVDFATLRLRFNKPLAANTVKLGESFFLLDADGNQVPGTLKVSGDRLVFDPHEDLEAGITYIVRLSSDIRSAHGDPLQEVEFGVPVKSSGQVAEQVMVLTPSDGPYGSGSAGVSDLVGQKYNSMIIGSTLVGDLNPETESPANLVDIGGSLKIDVADPRNYTNLIPFRIPKGQLLETGRFDIRLGGEVPLGLAADAIITEFLTDATGYFMMNPYDAEGPVTAVLYMDLGVSAQATERGETAQSVLNAEVLHVQAVGTLDIVKGVMHAEMFGAMEIPIMGGTERGTVHFNMKLSGPHDGMELLPQPPAMEVVSSFPEDGSNFLMPDDSVLVIFSSSIDPDSIRPGENLFLTSSQGDVPFNATVDGATLVIDAADGWKDGASYTLSVGSGIDSVAGVPFESVYDLNWTMPAYQRSDWKPQLLALNPGVPCALTGGDPVRPGMEVAGRCVGGKSDDDTYPVFQMRGTSVVEAYFNQRMDRSSLVLNETVHVERHLEGEGWEAVPGSVRVTERRFTFVPDQPWEAGELYRLTLHSANIKGANGESLNTTPLAGEDGAVEVVMPFYGAPDDGYVYQPLSPWPYTDLNGNSKLEAGERNYAHASTLIAVEGKTGLISAVKIDDDETEGDQSGYMYMNYNLLNEIGPIQEVDGERFIPVRVLPQFQHATSLKMTVTVAGILPSTSHTYQTLIRPRRVGDGRIYFNEEAGQTWFEVLLPLYVDAPYLDLDFAGDIVANARELIQSQEIELHLQGPLTNLPDGRIKLDLRNSNRAPMTIDLGFLVGKIHLQIPPQGVRINLVGPPLKGLNQILGAR